MSDDVIAVTSTELAAIKAEIARRTEERDQRAAERAASEELARARRDLANAEAVDKAEAEHGPLGGKIAAVYSTEGVVIVKRPNHMLFRRFQDAGKADSEAFEKLVRPCVVHPDKALFDHYVEEIPALLTRCADAVVTLAGAGIQDAAGKS